MMKIRKPMPLITVALPNLNHLTFVHEAPDGRVRAWDVTAAGQIVADGRKPGRFSLKDYRVTLEFILEHYEGIDEAYARTRDLSKPLIAVPQEERLLIIDGWHRLLRAVLEEVEELPLHLLTQEEADAALWLELPPGAGVQWR